MSEQGTYEVFTLLGLDGIMTSFATVTGVAGGGLSHIVILILGIAHLFADGLSMGMGDVLSTKAMNEYTLEERKREEWEMKHNFPGEQAEMVEIFINKFGFTPTDANAFIDMLSKYPKAFLDLMMIVELELLPTNESVSPYINGLVTMISFAVFGAVPLCPYLLCLMGIDVPLEWLLPLAVLLTLLTLFMLGLVKAKIVGIQNKLRMIKGGSEIALQGLVVAGLGYSVSFLVRKLTNQDF